MVVFIKTAIWSKKVSDFVYWPFLCLFYDKFNININILIYKLSAIYVYSDIKLEQYLSKKSTIKITNVQT